MIPAHQHCEAEVRLGKWEHFENNESLCTSKRHSCSLTSWAMASEVGEMLNSKAP